MLAEASRHVIVTAETIVERLSEKEATGAFIPGIHVDVVARAPFGAHPAGCAGLYGPDKAHMAEYVAASQDDASFDEYLRTYVLDVKDHDEYVERFVPRHWREPARAVGE
jgi:glutaconate CoA-transferase subunit A